MKKLNVKKAFKDLLHELKQLKIITSMYWRDTFSIQLIIILIAISILSIYSFYTFYYKYVTLFILQTYDMKTVSNYIIVGGLLYPPLESLRSIELPVEILILILFSTRHSIKLDLSTSILPTKPITITAARMIAIMIPIIIYRIFLFIALFVVNSLAYIPYRLANVLTVYSTLWIPIYGLIIYDLFIFLPVIVIARLFKKPILGTFAVILYFFTMYFMYSEVLPLIRGILPPGIVGALQGEYLHDIYLNLYPFYITALSGLLKHPTLWAWTTITYTPDIVDIGLIAITWATWYLVIFISIIMATMIIRKDVR